MNKKQFLKELETALGSAPAVDREKTIDFYSELIDDIVEEGVTEEEAVAGLGKIDDIAKDAVNEIPVTAFVKDKVKKRKITPLTIVLIIMASPIWAPVLLSAAAVVFSIYITVWAVIAAFFAVFAGFAAGAPLGIVEAGFMAFSGNTPDAIFVFGCALILAGAAIYLFYLAVLTAKSAIRATAWTMRKLKFRLADGNR